MICEVCGHERFRAERLTQTFGLDQRLIVVEGIPALVCERCGAANYDAQVAEHLRRLVHEPHRPIRIIEAEVLAYPAA